MMAKAGALSWESQIIWEYPGGLSRIVAGDCDNDGYNELIVIIETDGSGAVMLKNQGGYWVSSRIWSGIPDMRAVAIGDVDLDHAGDEVIVKNWTLKYIEAPYWYSNIIMLSYNGAFWEETVLWGSVYSGEEYITSSIAIGDVDPGHIGNEIVFTYRSDVILLEKIGSTWVSTKLWSDVSDLLCVSISDIDLDHPGNEVIVAGESGKVIKLLKNGSSWTAQTMLTHSSSIVSIAVPDDPTGPSWMLLGDQSGNVIRVDLLSFHTSVIFTTDILIYDIEIGKVLPESDPLTYKVFVPNKRDLIMIDGDKVSIVWSYTGQDWWHLLTDVVVDDFDSSHYGLEVAVVGEMGKTVYLKSHVEYEDQIPPTTIDDYDGLWHCADFTITLTAIDYESGVAETYYRINDGPTKAVSIEGQPLIAIEGINKLEYWSIDNAGNEELPHKILVGIKLDKTTPTGSIIINNGDAYTTSTSVTLTLTANDLTSGVYQVRYSNDNVWDNEPWEEFSPTKIWTLTQGDGPKTVYYQIKDKAGLISEIYSDTIVLDSTPPIGSIVIAGNVTYTNSPSVILTLYADDKTSGIAYMRFSQDGSTWTNWEPYAASKVWTLILGDGTKTVYVQYMDNAGLISPSYQDTIVLDTTKPIANAGSDKMVNVNATVIFDAGGSTDNMGIVSYEWDFGDGTRKTGRTVTHQYSNSGTYTVTLTVKDVAGNTATHSIQVTVLAPSSTPITPTSHDFKPLYYVGGIIGLIAIITVAYFLTRRKHPQPPFVTIPQSSEAQRYRQFLERLEEKYRVGEVPEDVYQKLKREYLEKLKGYEE